MFNFINVISSFNIITTVKPKTLIMIKLIMCKYIYQDQVYSVVISLLTNTKY